MPRTSIHIGGIGGLLRAQRRESGRMVGLLGETIRAHADQAGLNPSPFRTRLIEFASEGERGPPG